MKTFCFLCLACAGIALAVEKVPVFPAEKGSSAVQQIAFCQKGPALYLCFQLKSGTAKDFSLSNVYLFTDGDSKTGRKGIGNEYYFDIAKGMLSSYSPDGRGKLNRNALTEICAGDWYIIAFDESVTLENPIREFEIVFAAGALRDRAILRGEGKTKAELPELPERGKKMPPSTTIKPDAKAGVNVGEVEIFLAPGFPCIRSASDTTKLKKLDIHALRNAFEDFQLAVWFARSDRGTLRLYWEDIADADGKKVPGARLEFSRLVNVPFSEPVDPAYKRSTQVPSTMPVEQKMFPDRLTPYHQGSETGGYKQYLQKTLTVWHGIAFFPAEAKPGNYSAGLRVVYPGGEEKLTVAFHVGSFIIPERPSFVMFADLPRLVNYTSPLSNQEKEYPNAQTLDLEACLRNMRDHRVALRSLPVTVGLRFDDKEQPVLDFSRFDRLAAYVLDDLKMNPRLAMPLATVSTGHSSKYTSLYGAIESGHISDEFRRKYPATLRVISRHLREKGWDKYFFAYYSDEPDRSDFGQIAEVARIIKSADPSLEPWIYGPGPREEFMDVLHTWMGGFGTPLEEGEIQGDANSKSIAEAIRRGDKIGVYNPHEAYVLNAPATCARTLYWWAYQQNLYWMSMYCLGYFTTGPQDLTNRRYWHYWVYPPTPGNSSCWENSIRWEATRAGMTDYELLFAAEKRTGELKERLPSAANFPVKSIPMEYANAVSLSRTKRMENSDELLNIRNLLIREVHTLDDDSNRELPLLCHYRFNGSQIAVELYAPAGATASLAMDGKNLGTEQTSDAVPTVWQVLESDAVGKEISVTVKTSKVSRTVVKTILKPFGK